MALSPQLDRPSILKAMAEFDSVGRDTFLAQHHLERSKRLFIEHDGKLYDFKALICVANALAEPTAELLDISDPSMSASARARLHLLGFRVSSQSDDTEMTLASTFRDAVQKILDGYSSAKRTTFGKTSPLWEERRKAEKALQELCREYPRLRVSASVGKGNWSEIPWISILDGRLTSTTQQGIYIVYLFRSDMTGLYVTLNQGVTIPKKNIGWAEAAQFLKRTAKSLQERYRESLHQHFSIEGGISLRSTQSSLGAEYEVSTIAWRFYDAKSLPPVEEMLKDLYRLLDVYDDYASFPTVSMGSSLAVQMPEEPELQTREQPMTVSSLHATILARGYQFSRLQIATFVHSIRTKPFVILAGISGTGKSRLPALIADLTNATVELIPVRPDWTDSAELLGYRNIQGIFEPGRLLELAKVASESPLQQFFVILDEMNLARVEQYFAEVLSLLEDREQVTGGYRSRSPLVKSAPQPWNSVHFPPNLAIIGTVNMDETTHGFSRKVLDRAFTLEISEVDLTLWQKQPMPSREAVMSWPIENWRPKALRPAELEAPGQEEMKIINDTIVRLTEVNRCLSLAQLQVGYRVRDEMIMFLIHALQDSDSFGDTEAFVNALDVVLQMKILPRIQGGSSVIAQVLKSLLCWACEPNAAMKWDPVEIETKATTWVALWGDKGRPSRVEGAVFPGTAARLCLMSERLKTEHFTSFWL